MVRPRAPVVLVVEDEPLVLMMAIDIIEEAGFEALSAHNADDAIAILECRNDIGIVFHPGANVPSREASLHFPRPGEAMRNN